MAFGVWGDNRSTKRLIFDFFNREAEKRQKQLLTQRCLEYLLNLGRKSRPKITVECNVQS